MKHNWIYKKLGELAKSDLGKTLNHSTDKGNLYPYLCAVNVLWDRIDLTIIKQTKFEPYELERYSVQKGDLLICEGGDTGRAAIWEREEPMLYQNALHRVRFNSDVNARFVLYFLRHLKDIGDIDLKYSKGVTIKHLVKSSLMSIPLPIPSLDEQQAIVRELDGINRLIDLQEEQLREYDRLAQSLFYTTFGDPATNPKGWDVKKLGDITSICNTISWNKVAKDNNYYYVDLTSVVCETKQIVDPQLVNATTAPSRAKQIIQEGDILFGTTRPTQRRVCVVPKKYDGQICSTGFCVLRPNKEIKSEWLFFSLCANHFYAYIEPLQTGANYPAVSDSVVRSYQIPLPPPELQQTFAAQIEAIEQQKALVRKSLDETRTLLAARMQHYFE